MLPAAVRSRAKKQLVLHRSSRQLILLEQGQLRLRVPAAVGTQGWETPLGEHRVLFKAVDPVWRHPGTVALVPTAAVILWDVFGQDGRGLALDFISRSLDAEGALRSTQG